MLVFETRTLPLDKRDIERDIYMSILLDAESSPRFSSLINRLVLLQNVSIYMTD